MIPLRKLLASLPGHDPQDSKSIRNLHIHGIEVDSRKIRKNDCFIAIRGVKEDGGRFVSEAVCNGACAVIADRPLRSVKVSVPVVLVPDARQAAARLAGAFYGQPSKRMRLIGITGTNGKTTSAYLIEHLLAGEGKKVGVVGTINYRYADRVFAARQTTPGPLEIQSILSKMRAKRCQFVVMEVSSHALDQGRTAGIEFETGLFTNLTQDHLDYHGSLRRYYQCKSRLFTDLGRTKTSAINVDDIWGRRLLKNVSSKKVTYGIRRDADLVAANIQQHPQSTSFDVLCGAKRIPVEIPLIGFHNIYNCLGALAAGQSLGFSVDRLSRHLPSFPGVPGRLETVKCGQDYTVVIDFAHTPDGLENVLKTLKAHPKSRLITLFGCGGERDKTKRPKMGAIAANYSDYVVLTSDNPRSERPESIIRQVRKGFPKSFREYRVVADRREAIRQALSMAKSGDILLLAGKGHETVQVIGSRSIPFCEREIIRELLR